MVNFTLWPLLPGGKEPLVSIGQEAGWTPEQWILGKQGVRVWTGFI